MVWPVTIRSVAAGTPTATVEQGGINAPAGIAFDAAGNMWVAANGDDTVVRVDAAHLTTSGTGADLTISAWTPGRSRLNVNRGASNRLVSACILVPTTRTQKPLG